MRRYYLLLVMLMALAACEVTPPNAVSVTAVTAIPTLNPDDTTALCEAVAQQGRNWQRTIEALQLLQSQNQLCENRLTLDGQLYRAYVGYGTQLEGRGAREAAIEAYQTALTYNRLGEEARRRLNNLQIAETTAIPLEPCARETVAEALQSVLAYTPSTGDFVTVRDGQLWLNDEPFTVYGVNYYPRNTPFERFLTETNPAALDNEFALLRDSGLNTLRIFLRHEQLFICPANGAIPQVENISRLDAIIRKAAAYDLRLIVVLHHAPPDVNVLYAMPPYIAERTRFLVERYRAEPTILAWDMRDKGDADYADGTVSRDAVLRWLSQTVTLVRNFDDTHLITAGWERDAIATAPLVDVVSFQFYEAYPLLAPRIANLRAATDNPILLAGIGYSSAEMDEIAQRDLFYNVFAQAAANDLAGWLVYMAFDYPVTATCTGADCTLQPINRYGLWNTSYFPKLMVDAIEAITLDEP